MYVLSMENNSNNNNNRDLTYQKSILDLPDHFMVSVFKLLDLKQILKCARVCKKWNRCVKYGSLWSIIELRKFKNQITLKDVKQFIQTYGSAQTKEVNLCGNFCHDYSVKLEKLIINDDENASAAAVAAAAENKRDLEERKKLFYLDLAFMNDHLALKCIYLTNLSLEYLDLTHIKFKYFLTFENLNHISLKWCNISTDWFKINDDDDGSNDSNDIIINNNINHTLSQNSNAIRLNTLKNLQLIRTGSLNINDIKNICQLVPNLITLTINQAESSLGDDSIEIICQSLIYLEYLDLVNTIISDNAIVNICNSAHLCKNLKRLNLTMSSKISNNCLILISENLQNLKTLYLTSCFGISNINLLKNLINLKYLNLNNTSIDKESIKNHLLPILNKCEIEYGHEKMLNRKLMWTINGSRNCVCSF